MHYYSRCYITLLICYMRTRLPAAGVYFFCHPLVCSHHTYFLPSCIPSSLLPSILFLLFRFHNKSLLLFPPFTLHWLISFFLLSFISSIVPYLIDVLIFSYFITSIISPVAFFLSSFILRDAVTGIAIFCLPAWCRLPVGAGSGQSHPQRSKSSQRQSYDPDGNWPPLYRFILQSSLYLNDVLNAIGNHSQLVVKVLITTTV